ncbi:MAG: MgtC/SapB family protein [Treponema sp.]|nr:MgtC/SapB family protein [Treponema sp.]
MQELQELIANNLYLDYFFRLSASLICGFVLGFERKMKQHHTVGIRTLILISISSCMLSILSYHMAATGVQKGDPTRIAAAIVTGVGFLGAGAIVNQGLNIRGLTSAAITFAAAALGVTCGAGLYMPAATVLLFCVITLVIISNLETKFFPIEKRKILTITVSNVDFDNQQIEAIIKNCGISIHDFDIKYCFENTTTTLTYTVHSPDSLNAQDFISQLAAIKGITNISLSKN